MLHDNPQEHGRFLSGAAALDSTCGSFGVHFSLRAQAVFKDIQLSDDFRAAGTAACMLH